MKVWNRGITRGMVLLAVAAIVALTLAACGGGGATSTPTGGGAGGNTINVTEKEFTIEPKTMTAKAGEITFVIKNTGAVQHDLSWTVNGQLMKSDLIDPGKTLTWTVTIDKAGTYEGWCTVPGHKEAGMTATLNVTS